MSSKSRADLSELLETVSSFSFKNFRRVYFVVHMPGGDLSKATDLPGHVKVIPPEVLAKQAIHAGLVSWLSDTNL